jgi:hypothetical protein
MLFGIGCTPFLGRQDTPNPIASPQFDVGLQWPVNEFVRVWARESASKDFSVPGVYWVSEKFIASLVERTYRTRNRPMKTHVIASSLSLVLALALGSMARYSQAATLQACSETTKAAYSACQNEALGQFWIGNGRCQNESDTGERARCLEGNQVARQQILQECADQRAARTSLCGALGQAPYDPVFERRNFVDPDDIGGSVAPNPWFPLIPGRTLVYQSADETTSVTITHESKVIDRVTCRVVRDTVTNADGLVEDTIDWFAQDIYGNVWYCGEATAEYEDGFPANTDGSFQADVDDARPGLIMKSAPAVGDVYRQEFDLGNAEDAAQVIDLHGSTKTPAATCVSDCLVTHETTALEPDASENKYYKAGIGNILTIDLVTGARTKLIKVIDGQ